MDPRAKKRDPFLDFLKGLAILFVIIEHSINSELLSEIQQYLPIQAVPIFISITLLLSYSKLSRIEESMILEDWYNSQRIKSLWKNLFLPYTIVTIFEVIIRCIEYKDFSVLKQVIKWGGLGPGSYYIWVYIQIWILIPFVYRFLKAKGNKAIIFILFLCIFFNILLSFIQIPDIIYRLICVRYLFLTAIAYIWLKIRFYNKKIIMLLICMSAIYLIFFRQYDLTPLIYNGGWDIQNYPGYFFSLGVILLLRYIYQTNCVKNIDKAIYWCGENSWNLFLAQLFILYFFEPEDLYAKLNTNSLLLNIIICILIVVICISCVIFFHKIKNYVKL